MQLSLFTPDSKNKIVPFNRASFTTQPWMIELVDYVTDVMTPQQWNKAMETLFEPN
jgi:hypothetical protein